MAGGQVTSGRGQGSRGPRSKQPGAGQFLPTRDLQAPNPGTSPDLVPLHTPAFPCGGSRWKGAHFPDPSGPPGYPGTGLPSEGEPPSLSPTGATASGTPKPPLGSQTGLPRPGPGALPGSPGLCISAPPVGARRCRQAGLGGDWGSGRHAGQDSRAVGMTQVRTWCRHPRHVHRRPDGPGGGGIRTRAGVAQAASAWGLPWGQWLGSEGGRRDQPWASVGQAGVRATSPLPAQGPQSPSLWLGSSRTPGRLAPHRRRVSPA